MSDPRMARAPEWAKHLHECMHATQTEVAKLVDLIGREHTDDSGKVSGTGLTGRIIRTEAKVYSYDRLKDRVMGGMATATVLIAVLWWVVKSKVASALGVAG